MSTVCDFCYKPEHEVRLLLRSRDGRHHICDECTDEAHAVVTAKREEAMRAQQAQAEPIESGEMPTGTAGEGAQDGPE